MTSLYDVRWAAECFHVSFAFLLNEPHDVLLELCVLNEDGLHRAATMLACPRGRPETAFLSLSDPTRCDESTNCKSGGAIDSSKKLSSNKNTNAKSFAAETSH